MESFKKVLVVLVCVGYISCQGFNDIDIDDGLKDLQENIPELGSLNRTNLPNAEDVEKVLRDKCAQNGATDAVDLLKAEQENAKLCIEAYVNVTVVQEELGEAEKSGSMDEVFGKYCKLWPDMYACFENATNIARQCMAGQEETSFNRSLVILNDLQEFVCFKDGDRLAMFVAEGGVECVKERKDEVQRCFNETLGSRIPNSDELSITSLPTFMFTQRDCDDFDKVRTCINTELEKCKESTPANIVDAFFKFLKKQMPCEKTTPSDEKIASLGKSEKRKTSTSSSSTFSVTLSVFIFTISCVRFFR
ncbi:unnamed protein product [Phaedon cochleariae]|uniref:27 kDa hemolymph protein n=1 Tax=Phaedon cochleariae TaxID=80249 RepID=A0A9P0GTB9_PHACE|nr:unnamed protein product [Phaedon cochleariae]